MGVACHTSCSLSAVTTVVLSVWPIFYENPLFHRRPADDSHRRRTVFAMSKLLQLSLSPSYFPLPQNGYVDDDKDPGKETDQSSRGQGKRHPWLPWLQLAIAIVLLFLVAIAGFFIGLSHRESRRASSTFPDTVPQGSLCPEYHACSPLTGKFSIHRLVQGNIQIQ